MLLTALLPDKLTLDLTLRSTLLHPYQRFTIDLLPASYQAPPQLTADCHQP